MEKWEVLKHQSPLPTAPSLTAGIFCVRGVLLVKDYLQGAQCCKSNLGYI